MKQQHRDQVRSAWAGLMRTQRRVRWVRVALLASLLCSIALAFTAATSATRAETLSAQIARQKEQLAAKDAQIASLTPRVLGGPQHRATAERRRWIASTAYPRLEDLSSKLEEDLRALRESFQAKPGF